MFKSAKSRVFYRFSEIFLVAGTIGVLSSSDFDSYVPPLLTGVIAALLKALREYLRRLK